MEGKIPLQNLYEDAYELINKGDMPSNDIKVLIENTALMAKEQFILEK